ncbi:ATP-binding cassette, subfamily G (WHITE), member 1 [Enteropsectra breve]|nr:ATP-binding cassette, subfamily G (WHITE), member 1 [Enteropsectra breve]
MVCQNLNVQNLIYRAKNKATQDYTTLLKNINCSFAPGNIYAIMGPSGSSKTTFLNTLAGYIPDQAQTSGRITYDGKERNGSWFDEFSFLEQDDPTPKKISVIDYIRNELSYRKKRGNKINEAKIKEVLDILELTGIANRDISVISGGERKRTMVAVELACDSNILIFDEPTSGLDSNLALKLVTRLKEYAVNMNKIVLVTVHQPGPGLFSIFDNLLFFYKGTLLYNGPISEVEQAFASMGFVNSSTLSTAEFLFEVFSDTNILSNGEEMAKIKENLVISAEKKNRAVYDTADFKKGGYRLAAGGISPSDVFLNIKELFRNDLTYWPHGLKFVKDLLLTLLIFASLGNNVNANIQVRIKQSLEQRVYFFVLLEMFSGFVLNVMLLFSGTFMDSDPESMRRGMKRKNYSVYSAICSGLLYNGPFFVIGLILSFAVTKYIYSRNELETALSTFEIASLIIYTVAVPIVQVFFSTLSINNFMYALAVASKLYFSQLHGYYFVVRAMFKDRRLYPFFGLITEESPLYLKLFSYAYNIMDKGILTALFPFKHISICQFLHLLSRIKNNAESLNDLKSAAISELSEISANGALRAVGDYPSEDASDSLALVYKRLTSPEIKGRPPMEMEELLVEKVEKLQNLDEFFNAIRSEGIKKEMYLCLGKYFSMCYIGITLILLMALSANILKRRFAPDVRTKL